MRVLVLGASGFIGIQVAAALRAGGHEVVAAVRDARRLRRQLPGVSTVRCDLSRDVAPEDWRPHLAGVDAVVNCAGLLQAAPAVMEAVHHQGPRALYEACAAAGVRRVIHVSAISADEAAGTEYARSKLRGEEALAALALDWVILRPSLVYGQGSYGGTSLMRGMAALPCVVPLVGRGEQPFQPIHVDDLVATVLRLLGNPALARLALAPVGPETLTLRQILFLLRAWLGLPPARALPVPMVLVRAVAHVGDVLGWGPLRTTSLKQLEHGNAGPAEPFASAIGFMPRRMADMLAAHPAQVQDRWHARLFFVRPLLRLALAALWIGSGIAGLFASGAVADAALAPLGLAGEAARGAAIAASVFDIALGLAIAAGLRPRLAGGLQLAAVAGYTLLLSVAAPSLWADPYGPLLKNVPILAAILAWMAIEDDR
jgi:uncharacterized protein YbjT (DUF2867 family)